MEKVVLAKVPHVANNRSNEQWGLIPNGNGENVDLRMIEAYMVLGFCPPLYFCDLPDLNHNDPAVKNDYAQWLLQGCERSLAGATSQIMRLKLKLSRIRYGSTQ